MTKKLWFRNKRYGWGWTPTTWQGWLVIFAIVLVVLVASSLMKQGLITRTVWAAQVVVAAGILIALGYFKGPKPEWNWGTKK